MTDHRTRMTDIGKQTRTTQRRPGRRSADARSTSRSAPLAALALVLGLAFAAGAGVAAVVGRCPRRRSAWRCWPSRKIRASDGALTGVTARAAGAWRSPWPASWPRSSADPCATRSCGGKPPRSAAQWLTLLAEGTIVEARSLLSGQADPVAGPAAEQRPSAEPPHARRGHGDRPGPACERTADALAWPRLKPPLRSSVDPSTARAAGVRRRPHAIGRDDFTVLPLPTGDSGRARCSSRSCAPRSTSPRAGRGGSSGGRIARRTPAPSVGGRGRRSLRDRQSFAQSPRCLRHCASSRRPRRQRAVAPRLWLTVKVSRFCAIRRGKTPRIGRCKLDRRWKAAVDT